MPAHKCPVHAAGSVSRFPGAIDKTLPKRAMTAAAEPMMDFERMGETYMIKDKGQLGHFTRAWLIDDSGQEEVNRNCGKSAFVSSGAVSLVVEVPRCARNQGHSMMRRRRAAHPTAAPSKGDPEIPHALAYHSE
jgi:hypothetical protein